MLNRKAVKSRKRERSKLNVDVCIMESQIPLGPGKFHVVVLVRLIPENTVQNLHDGHLVDKKVAIIERWPL